MGMQFKGQGEILVADDNPDARSLLAQVLSSAGYVVKAVASGELALWSAMTETYDLVILDVRMPGMDGLDACRCMKRHPATAGIPVIFLSAADEPADRIAGFDAGALDFIGKPFNEDEVLARVRTHVEMARVAKQVLWRHQHAGTTEDGTRPPGSTEPSTPPEILIVDGDEVERLLLSRLLTSAGYGVREAPSGELAQWSVGRRQPDLILADARLPDMTGMDLCGKLKGEASTAHIPVIFVSAFDAQDDKVAGFAAGAADFIGKPYFLKEVLARVATHLRLSRPEYPAQGSVTDNNVRDDEGDWPVSMADVQEVFAASRCGTLFFDAGNRISYVNPAFVRMAGYVLADLDGTDPLRIFAGHGLPLGTAAGSAPWSGEVGLKTMNGDVIPCRMSLSTLDGMPQWNGRSVCRIATLEGGSTALAEPAAFLSMQRRAAAWLPSHNHAANLHGAIERKEMALLYQPIFDVASGRLARAEALLRWEHPEFGTLLPAQFMADAEESGEIVAIGAWVIATACEQYKSWQGKLPPDFGISVNLSSLQFWQDSLAASIGRALENAALPASTLEFDIAAETLLEDPAQSLINLQRLSALGVTLALDRLGVGKVDVDALSRMPLHRLKLDFRHAYSVDGGATNERAICGLIEMARGLNLKTVAGGIEHKWQLATIQSCRCDLAQGYLLGRPVAADHFLVEHLNGL